MKRFVKLLPFIRDRKGATAIEYGLIAGLIAIAIVGGVTSLGSATNAAFNDVNQKGWGN
ncbi:MAG: Flp family type IVb pilin [Alphaproteobacteria bacterium]